MLFKKHFDDGTLVSFSLVSHKKHSIALQSLYLDSADYKKKKVAETLLMHNTPAHTPKAQVGQPFGNSISQDSNSVNKKFSDRDPDASYTNRSLLLNALKTTAQNPRERALLGHTNKMNIS